MFLVKEDFFTIRESLLDRIIENDEQVLNLAINSAEAEAIAYLNDRYDTDALFVSFITWQRQKAYSEGDFVRLTASEYAAATVYPVDQLVLWTDGKIYICIQLTTGAEDPTDPLFWTVQGDDNAFYTAVQDMAVGVFITDTANWTLGDTRNQLLKTKLIDVSLMELYKRITPNNVPERILSERDNAILFFSDAANPKKNVSPDFPLRTVDDDLTDGINKGYDISWGSENKRENGANIW